MGNVMKRYDLVVIGTGTAAQVASARVRAAGRSVAVIDHRPFGGTCALRGCDPKKMLISGAEVVDFARRMHGHGVDGNGRIDWPALMAFKRSFTDPIPQKQERGYAERGIDAFHGLARFVGRDAVDVKGTILHGEHILIATGARPVTLGIPGEEHVATSDRFLELETLPKRIALIGGGYIAAEFSHISARAGASVTILQRGPRLLPQFDPDLVGWLTDKFREIGVDVRTNAAVAAVEPVPTGFRVRARGGITETVVEADLVVHAAGRVPDITTLPPLTPVSSHDGKAVAANVLEGNHQRPDYRGVPSVAFTLPPIARVGASEAEARRQGLKMRVKSEKTPGWYTARRVAESVYGYKTIVEEDTGRILGAHLVGPNVDEVINIFGLAIRHDLTATDLKRTIFGYPTGASDIGYMV